MRALVTGGSGFFGRHLCDTLRARAIPYVATSHRPRADFVPLDLADPLSLRGALDVAAPEAIFHLAGQSFVPQALESPLETYDLNALGTARLLHAVQAYRDETGRSPRVVVVSSATVYGIRPPHDMPLVEDVQLRPAEPYGASKAAAEAFASAAASAYGLDVVIVRPFNAVGPGQSTRFVVASFAEQIAKIAGGAAALLQVGNIETERDFLDVRDACEAFVAVAERGRTGEAYNVCSGRPTKVREILRRLIAFSKAAVEVREDPQRTRSTDMPTFVGSPLKTFEATGWRPSRSLDLTLRDAYDAAQRALQPA